MHCQQGDTKTHGWNMAGHVHFDVYSDTHMMLRLLSLVSIVLYRCRRTRYAFVQVRWLGQHVVLPGRPQGGTRGWHVITQEKVVAFTVGNSSGLLSAGAYSSASSLSDVFAT